MGSAGFDIGNELNNSLNYIFGTPFLCSTLVIPTYLAFLRGVLCSGDIAAVVAAAAALAGESIWSSDGVEALEVHESAPGEPDRSRSGDSAEVNLQRRLCWKERKRGHDTRMQLCREEGNGPTTESSRTPCSIPHLNGEPELLPGGVPLPRGEQPLRPPPPRGPPLLCHRGRPPLHPHVPAEGRRRLRVLGEQLGLGGQVFEAGGRSGDGL